MLQIYRAIFNLKVLVQFVTCSLVLQFFEFWSIKPTESNQRFYHTFTETNRGNLRIRQVVVGRVAGDAIELSDILGYTHTDIIYTNGVNCQLFVYYIREICIR